MTGIGAIAAATVGVRSVLGVSDTISNNVLLRERVANNIALGRTTARGIGLPPEHHRDDTGKHPVYIVLAKTTVDRGAPQGPAPANNPTVPSLTTASLPSVQEVWELMELKRELSAPAAPKSSPAACRDFGLASTAHIYRGRALRGQ